MIGSPGVASSGLSNSGLISGGFGGSGGAGGAGVSNSGVITNLTNAGKIVGGEGGLGSSGGAGGAGVVNGGTITALTNQGMIVGGNGGEGGPSGSGGNAGTGVMNNETIGTLTNAGKILGGQRGLGGQPGGSGVGLGNRGTISTLMNSGTISGSFAGVLNDFGSITTFDNLKSGVIDGGVISFGAIGQLTNAGTISGGIVSELPGTIESLTNSGKIIGPVEIAKPVEFIITGGAGKTFGSFSGGKITIEGGNLGLRGNIDLADDVTVDRGDGTVTNLGVLRLGAPETIFGNFHQDESGMLDFELAGDVSGEYGALTVTKGAMLGGRLALDEVDGFRLTGGDTFDLMTFSPDGGSFSGVSLNGTACSATLSPVWDCGVAGFNLDLVVGPNGVDATVLSIPEPSTWIMLATGLFGLVGLGLRASQESDSARDP